MSNQRYETFAREMTPRSKCVLPKDCVIAGGSARKRIITEEAESAGFAEKKRPQMGGNAVASCLAAARGKGSSD